MADYSQDIGSGLQGALGGALAGGSTGNPLGAIIGGGVGLLGGLFGNPNQDMQRDMLKDYYQSLMNRQAPQTGPAAQGSYSDFRGNQAALIGRLEAMANGQGPSLAAQQAQASADTNMRQQQAIAASGRGGAMANLTAANNTASGAMQAAQQGVMGRTAEELGAIGQLGGVINQGRQSDESMNMFNAQQQNQIALQNLDARLRTMGMNDQAREATMAQMIGMNSQPTMGQQLLAGGAGMFALGASQGGFGNSNKGGIGSLMGLGGLGGLGGGGGGGMSGWMGNWSSSTPSGLGNGFMSQFGNNNSLGVPNWMLGK